MAPSAGRRGENGDKNGESNGETDGATDAAEAAGSSGEKGAGSPAPAKEDVKADA